MHKMTITSFYLYLRGGRPKPSSAEAMYVWPMRNPNTTKDQENLLVVLMNQRRVVGLTLPIGRHNTSVEGGKSFPDLIFSTCWA